MLSSKIKSAGFFYKYCTKDLPRYVQERYIRETARLLRILESQLSRGKMHIVGDMYTIADIATWPWIFGLMNNYDDLVTQGFNGLKQYPHVLAYYRRCIQRPASSVAINVTPMIMET